MEASINTIIATDVKTKEQKREEGRRRALEMAIAKQSNESNTSTPNNKRRGNRKSDRHGARNQDRHKHFAKWILDKFPHIVRECSSSSSTEEVETNMHVLDIAGGKGELSARLALCHSLRVVMIDPRPADVASVYLNSVVPKLPKKWQHSLEERLKHTPSFIEDELDKRFSQLVTCFSVASDDDIYSDRDGVDCRVLFEDEAVEKAVRNASLIIGLHADGATEAIVDAALRYNKPFVIVPCCVFPNLFRHRFIYVEDDAGNGNEKKKVAVRSHEQFCQYLLDKDDRFRQEVLPFEGRNVAIWWDGK
ncbi:hypothetical protein QTG54_016793 [Skeletonema marinoi]|uniref:Methyltransferase domain-containing protein n=1 Tax=Skeletonema marinoi TaxID=267567 RepID=A0AAD9D4D4_9STRA|nr:hypothetical protein QTG54_016793 [Skeletonema marinoi]